jgi:hypothetical protein
MYGCDEYVMTVSVARMYSIEWQEKPNQGASQAFAGGTERNKQKVLVRIANGSCFLRPHKNFISTVYNIQYLHLSYSEDNSPLQNTKDIRSEKEYLTGTENILNKFFN